MKKCWCGNEKLGEYSDEYYKCDECHTLISKRLFQDDVYDVQDEENDLYGENYWEVSMTKAAGKNSLSEVVDMYLTERVIYWLKFVLKYVKLGADVAEIGCGLGQLQYVLKRLGYNQKAFELSAKICAYMETNLKIDTHCGEFVANTNGYDGIFAFDLFEHLIDPLDFLGKCADSLRDSGVLCFQTPCYDPKLSYDEMRKSSGKFEEQLKAEQHVYLYSRESIVQILKRYGFEHIVFEPAFFGDDYDMFLIASKCALVTNTDQEIDDYLNSTENGRLVKAMIALFDANQELTERYQVAETNSNARWQQVSDLKQMLETIENNCNDRMNQIDSLTNLLMRSEEESKDRFEQIKTLQKMLQESESDRTTRLEQINALQQMLRESESDRAARLEQINTLQQMLQESEADRAARLEQINTLTGWLKEKETGK